MRDKEQSPPEFETLLGRYFDGEATPEEAALVELRLQEDPEAAELLERFSLTRSMLREEYQTELSRVDFTDFWAGVEAGIGQIDAGRKLEPARRPVPADPGLWSRLRSWLEAFGWQPGLGLAAAAAVLAAVGLTQMLQDGQEQVAVNVPPPAPVPADGEGQKTAPPAETEKAPSPDQAVAFDYEVHTGGVEVSNLAGGAASTVMVIKSPEQATIIWVNEAEGQGGSSI